VAVLTSGPALVPGSPTIEDAAAPANVTPHWSLSGALGNAIEPGEDDRAADGRDGDGNRWC
jgi:hypothetical protein